MKNFCSMIRTGVPPGVPPAILLRWRITPIALSRRREEGMAIPILCRWRDFVGGGGESGFFVAECSFCPSSIMKAGGTLLLAQNTIPPTPQFFNYQSVFSTEPDSLYYTGG